MKLHNISRINVVGTSASGKSTLAKAIAAKLGYAYVEMDALWFKEDWQNVSDEEFNVNVAEATKADAWVLDGNYTRTVHIKWQRVEMVVWVDMPFYITLYRAVKRAIVRVVTQEPLWHGNRETWRKLLSKGSIVWWMIKTHKTNVLKYEAIMQDERYKHIQFVRLRSAKDVESFINEL
jgi:adenylate kinase family enzyme